MKLTTKEIMVCYVINGKHIPHVEELVETLRELEGMTSITQFQYKKNKCDHG